MTATDDDPIASWQERVGTLRKRGRVSAATDGPGEIDVRVGRPPAPERLSNEERELWERLTFSRRPGWFSGAESPSVNSPALIRMSDGAGSMTIGMLLLWR